MVYFQVGRWAGNAGGLCRRVGGRNFVIGYSFFVIGGAQPRPTSTPQGGGIGIRGGGEGPGNPGTYI